MSRVPQLYNHLGSATAEAWVEYPRLLEQRGWCPTFACETLDARAGVPRERVVTLRRVQVESADDIDAQMEAVAEVFDSAVGSLLTALWAMARLPLLLLSQGRPTRANRSKS